MIPSNIIFHKDDKHGVVVVEAAGRIVAKMNISDWSKAVANPRKINAETYDFGLAP